MYSHEMEMSDLYQLGRRLTELAYQGMGGSELDLTPSEFLVLRDLFMNGQSSISDTVARTGLAQSKVSTSVAKFRDRGWVTTGPDPQDGRKTLATVTEAVKLEETGGERAARVTRLTWCSPAPTTASDRSSPAHSSGSTSCS